MRLRLNGWRRKYLILGHEISLDAPARPCESAFNLMAIPRDYLTRSFQAHSTHRIVAGASLAGLGRMRLKGERQV